jgi:hypothetical protein
VQLPPLAAAPPLLMELLRDPEFRRQIRAYNQAFAFTSIGTSCNARGTFGPVNQDESVAGQRGVYTYRIQGAMGHYLGSLLPYIDARTQQPTPPKFAQIYIVDPDMEQRALRRRDIFSGLDPVALGDIEAVMAEHNPFVQQFITCGEIMRERRARGEEIVDVRFRLHADRTQPGTHNLPTVSEVAVTMVDDGNLAQPRDIILYARDHTLMRLYETHASYDPLQYPLLFPHGEMGWTYMRTGSSGATRHACLYANTPRTDSTRRRVTSRHCTTAVAFFSRCAWINAPSASRNFYVGWPLTRLRSARISTAAFEMLS